MVTPLTISFNCLLLGVPETANNVASFKVNLKFVVNQDTPEECVQTRERERVIPKNDTKLNMDSWRAGLRCMI